MLMSVCEHLWQKCFSKQRGMFVVALFILLSFCAASLPAYAASVPAKQATVKVDGVTLTVTSAGLPSASFASTDPGYFTQTARAVDKNPYYAFIIKALPYGFDEGAGRPAAQKNAVAAYRDALKKSWSSHTSSTQNAPAITLFGTATSGTVYHLLYPYDGITYRPTWLVEWVAEAGNRFWIVRVLAAETAATTTTAAPLISKLAGTALTSTTITLPTTLTKGQAAKKGTTHAIKAATDLSSPPWWNGNMCDSAYFPGSYALGASYRGVAACGPPNSTVTQWFYAGAWGVLEWQCVELSMRFLYLAYGINPYPGNGMDVVPNYNASSGFSTYNSGNPNIAQLQKVTNGTPNALAAGDVMSLDTGDGVGHTLIVTGTNLDASGTGTISTLEENNTTYAPDGSRLISVSNWNVTLANFGISWLHYVGSGNNPPPSSSASFTDSNAYTCNTIGYHVTLATTILPGHGLCTWAADGTAMQLVYQGDGNLVLYIGGIPKWSTNTGGQSPGTAQFQGDGNLVVYNASGKALWGSGTNGKNATEMDLQGDGNLVIYASGLKPLWGSGTPYTSGASQAGFKDPNTYACHTIGYHVTLATTLLPGHGFCTWKANGTAIQLVYQGDGNLVIYIGGVPKWSTNTGGQAPGTTQFQGDGNLVVYNASNQALWGSGTNGKQAIEMDLQGDGNLVIYASGLKPLWGSGTSA